MSPQDRPGWTRHLITFLLIFGVGGYMMLRGRGCRQNPAGMRPPEARVVSVRIERWEVKAELADTPELRRKGLSGRTVLEPGYGMLFVYEEPAFLTFWMKDTTIPLSIAFIHPDGTIAQIERMQPQDLTRIPSDEAVQYALEVRQGWFEERGIRPGVKAVLPELKAPVPEPEATDAASHASETYPAEPEGEPTE